MGVALTRHEIIGLDKHKSQESIQQHQIRAILGSYHHHAQNTFQLNVDSFYQFFVNFHISRCSSGVLRHKNGKIFQWAPPPSPQTPKS